MWEDDRNLYLFVVDTASYAGSFEREMCAFVTGQIGECGVGREVADQANDGLLPEAQRWFGDHVVSMPDDHGCCRPVTIFSTPGRWSDGMGNEYPDAVKPTDAEVVERYETAQKRRGGHGKGPGRFPAYDSVAIFLNDKPPAWVADLMRQRAECYAADPFGRIEMPAFAVTGFRLLRRVVTYTEER